MMPWLEPGPARIPITLAWAQRLPANQDRSQILQSIIATLAETNPQKAAILAMGMPGRWQMFTAEQVRRSGSKPIQRAL